MNQNKLHKTLHRMNKKYGSCLCILWRLGELQGEAVHARKIETDLAVQEFNHCPVLCEAI